MNGYVADEVLNIWMKYVQKGKASLKELSCIQREVILTHIHCRPPGFTVMSPGKCMAGGLQSGCTANSTGAQYK